jgi:hypothetical protein
MPTIVSTVYADCTNTVGTGSSSRLVKNVYDATGTGVLIWDLNNGVLPDYPQYNLEVYANGVRKEYGAEFTITRNTAPGQSTVTILSPLPAVYYTIIMFL